MLYLVAQTHKIGSLYCTIDVLMFMVRREVETRGLKSIAAIGHKVGLSTKMTYCSISAHLSWQFRDDSGFVTT